MGSFRTNSGWENVAQVHLKIDFHKNLSKYSQGPYRGEKNVLALVDYYTVAEPKVRFSKRLEMIEKQNNFYISCLYLQEYKKGIAFFT